MYNLCRLFEQIIVNQQQIIIKYLLIRLVAYSTRNLPAAAKINITIIAGN